MTTPIIALIGSPNTGKSTLFNRLSASRKALVADYPGVTRDRLYSLAKLHDRDYLIIDTGGFSEQNQDQLTKKIHEQIALAIQEADLCLLVVDSTKAPSNDDLQLVNTLRSTGTNWLTLLNKTDKGKDVHYSEFYQYYPSFLPISASHNRGLDDLYRELETKLSKTKIQSQTTNQGDQDSIGIAIIGRPNVGKSTLINRIIGKERVMALDLPGTTRDKIEIPFTWRGQRLRLIDTPGIRRRAKVHHYLEKFSVLKSLQAAQDCQVAIIMVDTEEGLVEQDLRLIETVKHMAPAIVFAINKSDLKDQDKQAKTQRDIDRRHQVFLGGQPLTISALQGKGISKLLKAVVACYDKSNRNIPTSQVNSVLQRAIAANEPPISGRRRPKLKFIHQKSTQPLTFIIHGNQTGKLNQNYIAYLHRSLREQLELDGVCFRLAFKDSENPYKA